MHLTGEVASSDPKKKKKITFPAFKESSLFEVKDIYVQQLHFSAKHYNMLVKTREREILPKHIGSISYNIYA